MTRVVCLYEAHRFEFLGQTVIVESALRIIFRRLVPFTQKGLVGVWRTRLACSLITGPVLWFIAYRKAACVELQKRKQNQKNTRVPWPRGRSKCEWTSFFWPLNYAKRLRWMHSNRPRDVSNAFPVNALQSGFAICVICSLAVAIFFDVHYVRTYIEEPDIGHT